MGIFDGLKRNLNIGGPKVRDLVGPNVFSFEDAVAPLAFTVVGGGAAAHVNVIELSLMRERRRNNPNGAASWENTAVREVRFDNGGAGWDVDSGERLPFTFDLPLNVSEQLVDHADAGGFMAGAAGFMQGLSKLDGLMNPDDRWSFDVRVDVADVVMDPGAKIMTTLRSPGEFVAVNRWSL